MTQEARKWPNRMNATDALFWLMDKIPEMRSTIGALVILERSPSRERIREEFLRLSQHLVRMRQRVAEVPFTLAPPEWVADPQFDLDFHLRFVAVPAPGSIDDLLEEMSPLYATAFDRDRPLWEAYVAEGLLGGRGAVFVKMHHCLMDGVGGSRLFESLLSEQRETPSTPPAPPLRSRATSPTAMLRRALLYNVEDGLNATGAVLASLGEAVRAPRAALAAMRQGLRTFAGFSGELTVQRAESPLHHFRSLSRRLTTFEMSLPDINAVRARLDATNNDVVLTIVSGAMHRWHTSRGADVKELRALVPVSIRSSEDAALGNRIGLLAVNLPIGEPDPLRRLDAIQARMGQIKTDRRARLYPLMARVMMAMPIALAEWISRQQTARTNFVCTNVPGPRQPCYLGGEVIEKIYPYAPLVGDHPVAIALYSYRDTLCVGLDTDPLAMADLPHLRDALKEAYDEVLNIGRQAPPAARKRRRTRRQARTAA
jgi:diacylglycerol O-acyltransferase